MTKIGDWQCVMRFEGREQPESGVVKQDCEAMAAEAMNILVRDILEAGEGKN